MKVESTIKMDLTRDNRRRIEMSRVTFYPKQGTKYEDGWPETVLGNGFIDLRLVTTYGPGSAVYWDNFREEYEFFDCEEGEWTVEVRED